MRTVEAHCLESEGDRIVPDLVASLLLEVRIDPTVVLRREDVALDRGQHAEPTVLRLRRLALSAERSTIDINPERDGARLRLARNPGSRRPRPATTCPPPASARVGKSFHPVEVMTRAEGTPSIHGHPVRCGPEVPRC